MKQVFPNPIAYCSRLAYFRSEFLRSRIRALARSKTDSRDAVGLYVRPRDLVGASIIADGVYEAHLLEALRTLVIKNRGSNPPGIAIDVGANIGNHTLVFSEFFPRVLAFEPHPATALVLRANVLLSGRSNIEVHAIGLGASNESLSLFSPIDNQGEASFVGRSNQTDSVNVVPCCRGDDVLAAILSAEDRVELVKIDAEGFERQVLDGMAGTVARHTPWVAFEAHGKQDASLTASRLSTLGYEHFYSIGRRHEQTGQSAIRRFAARIRYGADSFVFEIDEFEDRFYGLILSTVRPLE